MFARKLSIWLIDRTGARHVCPVAWIDDFAMRNFSSDPVLDDTLPVDDGLLEAGTRVPVDRLRAAMESFFRDRGYLKAEEALQVEEVGAETH